MSQASRTATSHWYTNAFAGPGFAESLEQFVHQLSIVTMLNIVTIGHSDAVYT